jgi:hypothetical protein
MKCRKISLGVIIMIALGITATTIIGTVHMHIQTTYATRAGGEVISSDVRDGTSRLAAPLAVSGDNIYVAWWTNKTGNDEVMFRVSTDGGKTFGDKINLSNTTNANSTRVEIDSDANSVVVTWWETNKTSNMPVMKVSNDNGKTFGPLLNLAFNGTISSGEAKGIIWPTP